MKSAILQVILTCCTSFMLQAQSPDMIVRDSTGQVVPGDTIRQVDMVDYITSSGISLSALYDNRPGNINPQRGAMGSVTYSFFTSFLGSTVAYQFVYMDARKYSPLPGRKHDVFAVRSYY